MTEVFIKAEHCLCEGTVVNKRLVLVEGNTSVWACVHTKRFIKQQVKDWIEKK